MHALIVASLLTLGASGSGAAQAPGRTRTPGNMGASFDGAAVGEARATLFAPKPGQLTTLHVESLLGGANGAGSTLDLTIGYHDGGGVHGLCTLTIPCTLVGNASVSCDATFDADTDLHFFISASSCAIPPRFVGGAVWIW